MSEDDARRALARAGHGAWLFTAPMGVTPSPGTISWVVAETGEVIPLQGDVLSIRDALATVA